MAKSKLDGRVAKLLKAGEIVPSAEVVRRLLEHGMKDVAARKLMQRESESGKIWRSNHLKLTANERLFALPRTVGSSGFLSEIQKRLKDKDRRGLARCLQALRNRRVLHWITASRLLAVSPTRTPESDRAKRPTFVEELAALVELGAKVVHEGVPATFSLVLPWTEEQESIEQEVISNSKILAVDSAVCKLLCNTLAQQNVLGWNQIELPTEETAYTLFNGHVFSAHGYSYLAPLTRSNSGSRQIIPCPVVVDCYSEVIPKSHVESFIERTLRATHRGDAPQSVLAIIAAKGFEADAWKLAKSSGLMVINLSQLYGEVALDAMVIVDELLRKVSLGANDVDEPELSKFSGLLEEMKNNPIVSTLRSIALEVVCALVLASDGFHDPQIGKLVKWKDTMRDVDVFASRGNELCVVECKAHRRGKSVTDSEISKFFEETVPALKKWMKETERRFKHCRAEIWTTGSISSDAKKFLASLPKPASDHWEIRTMDDLKDTLPDSVRKRILELTNTISIGDSSCSE